MTANLPFTNPNSDSNNSNPSGSNPVQTNALSRSVSPKTSTSNQISDHDAFCWREIDSLKFVMQVLLTLSVLTLCVGKLVTSTITDDKALYWGGITGIMAWWMPSPGSKPSTKKSEDLQHLHKSEQAQ